MFARSYFAGAHFAPVYFPPVVSQGPEPETRPRDARAFGEMPYDFIGLEDNELMELIPIFLIALEGSE